MIDSINHSKRHLKLFLSLCCFSLLSASSWAQFQNDGLDFTIPTKSTTPDVCPSDYTTVGSGSNALQNITGKLCVDGGTISGNLGGTGELYITSDTKFSGNIQNINGATIVNYSNEFTLNGSAPNGNITLYNYGKITETGLNNINKPFTIYNDIGDTVIFNNTTQLSNTQINNKGYVIFSKKIATNSSVEINNQGYVEMPAGSQSLNGDFKNSGRITGSGNFKLQGGTSFENGCGILIDGSLEIISDITNNGVLLYTGNWNLQGKSITNTSDGKISGGTISGSGKLLGSGEYYLTGSYDNGLIIGNASSDFVINELDGKTANGSVTENNSLKAATVDDFPDGCSPIVEPPTGNDNPTLVNDAIDFIEDGGIQTANVSTNDDDDGGVANLTYTVSTAPDASLISSFSLSQSGVISIEAIEHFNGEITFEYEACDAGNPQKCANATVTMDFDPRNDPPLIKDDYVTLLEDQSKSILPVSLDKDSVDLIYANISGNGMKLDTFSIVTNPVNGTLDISQISTGVINYTPSNNFVGNDSIEYFVCDDTTGQRGLLPQKHFCGTAWIHISVTGDPTNDEPVALNDLVDNLTEDKHLPFYTSVTSVLDNDDDDDIPLGDEITVVTTSTSTASGASIAFTSDGHYQYALHTDFHGKDSVEYTITDKNSHTTSAWLIFEVAAQNDSIHAVRDETSVDEDQTIAAYAILSNDINTNDRKDRGYNNGTSFIDFPTDEQGGLKSVNIITAPLHGKGNHTINIDNTLFYEPALNFNGTDSLEYEICDLGDPGEACTSEWVVITVDAVNDKPNAIRDTYSIIEDNNTDPTSTFSVNAADGLLNNGQDTDTDNDPLTVAVSASSSSIGTFDINADGSFDYTPSDHYFGLDSIAYVLSDGTTTDTAYVVLTITAVNDAIVVENDFETTQEEVDVDISVYDNDNDLNDIKYGPSNSNDLPAGSLGGLDFSSLKIITPAKNGTAIIVNQNTGIINYDPDNNFNGSDSIVYELCDLGFPLPATCNTATIHITVDPVNDKPVALSDYYTLDEDNGTDPKSDYVVNAANGVLNKSMDTDPDNDPLTVIETFGPTIGTFNVDADGSFTYTPSSNYFGLDSVAYVISDGSDKDTAYVVLNLNALNDEIIVTDDVATTDEEVAVDIALYVNDNDDKDLRYGSSNTLFTYSSDSLGGIDTESLTITTQPSNGSLISIDKTTGVVNYLPALNFEGTDTFVYRLCDKGFPSPVTCNTATVTITVNNINDAPVAEEDAITICEDNIATIDVLANDNDTADAVIDISDYTIEIITPDPQIGSAMVQNGEVVYTPQLDATGIDTVHYKIYDNGSPIKTDESFIVVTITPINDTLSVKEVIVATAENTATNFNIFNSVNDNRDYDVNDPLTQVDFANVTLSRVLNPATEGTITNNNDGTFDFNPANNVNNITISIDYTVCDKGFGDNTCGGTESPICGTNSILINISADVPRLLNDTLTGTVGDTLWEDESAVLKVLANDSDPNDNGRDNLGNIDISTLEVIGIGTTGQTGIDVGNAIIDVDVADSSLIITPKPNYYTGSEPHITFTYQVKDETGFLGQADVFVRVWAKNDVPQANLDFATVLEDSSVFIPVLSNDRDTSDKYTPSGQIDPLTLTVSTTDIDYNFLGQPSNGVVEVDGLTNTIKYTPDTDFFGVDSFYYAVADKAYGEGSFDIVLRDTALVIITVTPVNDPPVLPTEPVSFKVYEEQTSAPLDITAFVIDDIDQGEGGLDTATFEITTQPNNGVITITNHEFTYTPNLDYYSADTTIATDTAYYAITDVGGATITGTILLTVHPINDTITVSYIDDVQKVVNKFNVGEDIMTPVNWTSKFDDSRDTQHGLGGLDTSSIILENGGITANGTYVANNDVLEFTPIDNFDGIDTIRFQVCDLPNAGPNTIGNTDSITCVDAAIVVEVNAENDPPEITDSLITMKVIWEDSISTVYDILNAVKDIDGNLDLSSFKILSIKAETVNAGNANSFGQFNLTNNEYSFRPALNYFTSDTTIYDTASYSIADTDGITVLGKILFKVLPINDTMNITRMDDPIARIIDNNYTGKEDTTITINWAQYFNDDIDTQFNKGGLDTTSFTSVNNGITSNGSFTEINGIISYTPSANFEGNDTILFNVCDIPNAGPNEIGSDSMRICLDAGFVINVVNVNDTIQILDSTITLAPIWEDDTSVTYSILDYVNDADGDIDLSTFKIITIKGDTVGEDFNNLPVGQFVVKADTFIYIPAPNYYNADTTIKDIAVYTLADSNGVTVTGQIALTVLPINDPIAHIDYVIPAEKIVDTKSGLEDTEISIYWVDYFNDQIDTLHGLGGVNIPTFEEDSNGVSPAGNFFAVGDSIFYTPNKDFDGTDTLRFSVCDIPNAGPNSIGSTDSTTCTEAALLIEIVGENDPPIAENDTFEIKEDSTKSIWVTENDSDKNDDYGPIYVLQSSLITTDGVIATVDGDSAIIYTPKPNYFGLDSIQYTIIDDGGEMDSAWVIINVLPVNDVPILGDDISTGNVEDDNVEIVYIANDSDEIDEIYASLDTMSFRIITPDVPGSFDIDTANGTLIYIPVKNSHDQIVFEYELCDNDVDGTSLCATAKVTIDYTPVNDKPDTTTSLTDCSITFLEDSKDSISFINYISDAEKDDNQGEALNYVFDAAGLNDPRDLPFKDGWFMDRDGNLDFDLKENINGTYRFKFLVSDGLDHIEVPFTACLFVQPVNDAPFAIADTVEVQEDSLLTFNLLANDFDIDTTVYQYDTIKANTIEFIGEGLYGTFDLDITTGIVTYTPDANISNVTDSIQYVIFDTLHVDSSSQWRNEWTYTVLSDTAWIKVNINDINDNPVVTDPDGTPIEGGGFVEDDDIPGIPAGTPIDTLYLTTEALTELIVDLYAYDPEGGELSASFIIDANNGETDGLPGILNGGTISFSYLPGLDSTERYPYVGMDTLLVRFDDTNGGVSLLYIIIDVTATDIVIYDGFSPNGDGVNDDWVIEHIEEYPDNSVQIFNRWGNLVWDATSYNNSDKLFRGYSNSNNELTTGTYFYVVEINELGKSYSGYVIINR